MRTALSFKTGVAFQERCYFIAGTRTIFQHIQRVFDAAQIVCPSKIIDLNCCPLAFIGNCSTFVVACANEPSNVERWEHRTINKVPKRGKIPSTTAP